MKLDNQHGAAILQKSALIFTIPVGMDGVGITGAMDGDGMDGMAMAGTAMDGDGTPDGDGIVLDGDLVGVTLTGMVVIIALLTIMEVMPDITVLITIDIHTMEDLVIEHTTGVQETRMLILPEVAEHIIIQNTTQGHEDLQLTAAEADKDTAIEELMPQEEHDLQQTTIITDPDLQTIHILVHDPLR